MRYMIMVKATPASEAAKTPLEGIPPEEAEKLFADMAAYHEELAKAGALLDGAGLHPSAKGWRVKYSKGKPRIVDGPFAEAKELIAGYTLIQLKSREEAMEWARRFPSPFGSQDCEIEVRQLFEQEDFEPGPTTDRFRELGMLEKK